MYETYEYDLNISFCLYIVVFNVSHSFLIALFRYCVNYFQHWILKTRDSGISVMQSQGSI